MEQIDNRYKIIKNLGSGLSGEVYAVEDEEGGKALKFLKRVQLNVSREEALKSFKNEFSILSELNHPNIGRILDFGFDSRLSKYYFTSELIEGDDFFSVTDNQPIGVIEDLAVQVLRALNYLHTRGIYHFDIKPQNILVAKKGGGLTAKIIDFGLAGFSSPRKKVGTPAYMAPEIILGGSLDGRTDLYSFGVVLYKALTRENPFVSNEVSETLNRHRSLTPPLPSAVNGIVPKYWDRILPRLLEKSPTDRYPQASSVIRDINFLANKTYEMETMDTRLSYLPEKGTLIGRRKEVEIFETLFEMIFTEGVPQASRLLIAKGKTGTGKTRLLSEFKYHSQLHDIPVYAWKTFEKEAPSPPFCLHIDETEGITEDRVNRILQQYASDKILIVWATQRAPAGWGHSETITLHNFTEEELSQYIAMVTGLTDAPKKLVRELFNRTDGNPLFVSEILKTLLADNLLLDSSGRWASSTFEDIGINFEKIQVPNSLSGLLRERYLKLKGDERSLLQWMAVLDHPVSLETLRILSTVDQPQSAILALTREDLIERTDREHRYFFTNVLMRHVLYSGLSVERRRQMHDEVALYFEGSAESREEYLQHMGHGSDDTKAIGALETLGEQFLKKEEFARAIGLFEEAWERVQNLDPETQVGVERRLAESMITGRNYKAAVTHYQHLKSVFDKSEEGEVPSRERIRIYEKLGDLYAKLDEYDTALGLFDTALSWLRGDSVNRVSRMIIENHRANVFMKSSRIDEAERIFKENYAEWESSFSPEEKKEVTNNWLGDVLILKKEYTRALEQVGKDERFFETIGDRFLMARAAYIQGDAYFKLMLNTQGTARSHQKQMALESFERCLKLAKEIDAYDMMLRAYNGTGNLHYYEKEHDQSAEDYQRALALARKLEDFQTAATISLNLGNIFKIQKKFRDAYAYLIYSINTLESLPQKSSYNWIHLFNSYVEIAETYRQMEELLRAEEALNKAEDLLRNHAHLASYEFWVWFERAQVYRKQNHRGLCQDALKKAKEHAREGLEKEEWKKLQEVVVRDFSLEQTTPTSAIPWILKPMKSGNQEASVSEYETILHINKFLNSEHDPQHLLKMVLNYALEMTGAESGLVLLVNQEGKLEVKASVNTTVDEDLTKISTSVAHRAIETGEMVVSADALTDGRFDSSESVVLNELKSVLCLPLKSKNKSIGVLYLDNRVRTNAFENVNTRVLASYCDQVGIALENARLIARYQDMQQQLQSQLEKTTGELAEVREILKTESSGYMARYSYEHIISKSKPMREIFKVLDKITETNLFVYIYGASGTGKELIAQAIHHNNPSRRQKRFVAINCGAIPATLIESELFGYKAGSFTGAQRDKKGLFEEADGGTLFLDEIAELELSLQVKLLRVLQEGEVMRIGDVKPIKVDARVVCASHRVLEDLVKGGKFREDLFYRLCQIKIAIPPLVNRKEDIPLLTEHFIEAFRKENKVKEKIRVNAAMMKALIQYNWPGNVRELENLIEVACALRNGNTLDLSCLPPNYGITQALQTSRPGLSLVLGPDAGGVSVVPIDDQNTFDPLKTWDQYETLIIAKCFQRNEFKKGATAEMLGISPSTLYKKIKDSDLENRENSIYSDPFAYKTGMTLKDYIPKIFLAALKHADDHPYAAIRQLGVSQGYFYKILKQEKAGAA